MMCTPFFVRDKLQFVGPIGGRGENPPPNVADKLQFIRYFPITITLM